MCVPRVRNACKRAAAQREQKENLVQKTKAGTRRRAAPRSPARLTICSLIVLPSIVSVLIFCARRRSERASERAQQQQQHQAAPQRKAKSACASKRQRRAAPQQLTKSTPIVLMCVSVHESSYGCAGPPHTPAAAVKTPVTVPTQTAATNARPPAAPRPSVPRRALSHSPRIATAGLSRVVVVVWSSTPPPPHAPVVFDEREKRGCDSERRWQRRCRATESPTTSDAAPAHREVHTKKTATKVSCATSEPPRARARPRQPTTKRLHASERASDDDEAPRHASPQQKLRTHAQDLPTPESPIRRILKKWS